MSQEWRERWVNRRNAVLMNPDFQRLAWKLPIFRSVARRRARAMFDLVAGFTYSQLLFAGVRLGLIDMLRTGPQHLAELAEAAKLPPESADRLLKGLAALGVTERLGEDRYALGEQGAALVANPGVMAMIDHHDLLYADLADPVELLCRRGGGRLSGYWPYAEGESEGDAAQVAPYSKLMAASQPMVAAAVLDSFDFRPFRVLMDVGGGEGAFLEAVSRRHPGLSLMLFDLPAVAARARARLGEKVTAIGGSFAVDPLPTGADLVSLVRILHDHDDEVVLALLRKVRACLPPGGTVLIAEPMSGTPGAEAMGDAYFGLYLLAMGSGRPRTPDEIMAMLRSIGFADVRQIPTRNPFAAQLVSGRVDATTVNSS
jgi:demethylspheroidene O-methyltransferase